MNNRKIFALLTTGTLLAAPAFAAQRWGRAPLPDSGACLYELPQFRGRYFCARPGEALGVIPNGMNDRVSSIRVFGGAQAVVFSFSRFGGSEAWFDYDVPDLRAEGWEDRVSSLRVLRRPFRDRRDERSLDGPRGDREGRPRERGSNEPPRNEPSDRGRSSEPPRDQPGNRERSSEVPQEPPNRGGSSRVDSAANADAIVRRAYQDLLHREPDAGGLQQYRDRILKDRWTEAQVRQSITDSPEYRAPATTMTREKAQGIVRAVYLALLKREPDPGSAVWVDHLMQDHWSQQDLEREIRNSAEYREKNR